MAFVNNIESSSIINRKMVIELRFEAQASILDKKGSIADALSLKKIFAPGNFWEINANSIRFRDFEDNDRVNFSASISHNMISFVCNDVASVDSFFEKYKKMYDVLKEFVPNLNVLRIGCRILGAYKVKSSEFAVLLSRIKKDFPERFYVDPFSMEDMSFVAKYKSGMYQIGPLNHGDQFYQREFPAQIRKDDIGMMIDTDNFLVNDGQPLYDIGKIKTVFVASLAVEKAVYEKLSEY